MRTYKDSPLPEPRDGQDWKDWAKDLSAWIRNDSARVKKAAIANTSGVTFQILTAAPERVVDGEVLIADGSNYDPGSGAGMYYYDGSAYTKIGPYTSPVTFTNISTMTSGVATLVNGVVTVSLASVTADTRIFAFHNTKTSALPSAGNPASLWVSARSVGTSFTITSSGVNDDDNVIAWLAIEP